MSNTVLVADDSKLVVSLIKNIFETQLEEYSIVVAEDGKEAIDKVHKSKPDLILMDWEMPVMNGISALAELKADEKTRDIPVIMLTGSDNTAEAFEKGAFDFVQKPFDKASLISRVKAALQIVAATKELKQKSIELDIIRDKMKMQKDIMVKQKKEISESLMAVTKLQEILLPADDLLNQYLPNQFILYQPKDELSRTLFKAWRKGAYTYLALITNATQGMQAVLVNLSAMLTIQNELDLSTEFQQPSAIIENVKSSINDISYQDDCLDILILVIDPTKRIIQYAGINIPFFVVKNGKITELKTDIAYKGLRYATGKILNHKVQLAENDVLYFVKDGFNERKLEAGSQDYLSSELSKVFLKIFNKPADKQKELLEKTFESWKKELRQLDDILVMGITF